MKKMRMLNNEIGINMKKNKDAEKLSRKQHYESYNNLIVDTKNKKSMCK